MFRTALRNVLAHKARLLMTVLAVMLGVAFVAGTLVFTSTIQDAFQKSSEKGFSHVDVAIQPDDPDKDDKKNLGPAPNLTQKTLDEAAALPGAKSATGVVSGFAGLSDKDGDLVGDGWGTLGANYYAGPDGKGSDHRYPMKEGRAPANAGEIAIDHKTADRTGYEVGDTVATSLSGPVHQEKVVGVFTTDDGNVAAGGSLVLFDNDTAQKLFAEPGQYTEIQLRAAAGTTQQQLETAAEKILPPESKAVTGQKLADDQSKEIESQMSGMQTAMLAFAGIALFVGIFIIANTFTMLVAQRTKELALLRAVGASRRQVTRSVLIEATAVGVIAAVAGLAAGIGIAVGLRSLVGSLGEMPDGPLIISPTTIVTALVVGVVVTVLAAWLPARRAAKIPPVAAMGSMHAPATTRSLIVRNSIGAVLAGGGAALVIAASASGDNALMGLGAGLLLIGVFVLTPLLSRPLIAASAPVLRLFNVSGKLARQNAVRNPRRTAATASALMIGLTLITGLTVIASGVQNAIDKMASDAIKADYTISMANFEPLSPDVEEKLRSMDQVTSSTAYRFASTRLDGENETLMGVNGDTVSGLTQLDFTAGSWDGLGGGKKIVVDDDTAEDNGWKVGSDVAVTYQDGAKGTLSVGGIYKGNALMSGAMVDNRTLTPHLSKIEDMQVMVKTKDGASESVKESLEKGLGNNPAVLVQDKEDLSESIAQVISLMLNILYGLLAMAVIVAVLGVVNTLAMSVFERGQEIGMLRAIGLDRRGIKRMVRLESLVISLFGGVLGIGLGVFLGWSVGELIASAGLDAYSLVLPWGRMALFLALAAAVGVLAALWPARRAAKMNMLAAIKTE
ncbi:ABC transporter permease [Streptomyces sp. N2-109]|uniref:ABC transporter permease n=1 Tax=Streptomyces gossypii TaxID=2883101 RepID=A0ABT2JZZ4_9ACTN|nr:ABC transporter permease [Streptomyces gossypii]MCT2592954.1 ABC transporter permease [Streptomyces gossypii]MCT2593687.1 ABC transporter permease [Streptomyces gossypii]